MKNIREASGAAPSVKDRFEELADRIERIEKLLETINLRLAGSGWKP